MNSEPHVNDRGDLVVPINTPEKFRYWAKGQSLAMTLIELGVDEIMWARYTTWPYMDCPEFHPDAPAL